ncbi:MAG: hypothetical protein HQ516_07850 [Chlorobium sp.]|nr:hypothetical protein [Chlorobium phaeovibrioides]NQU46942.1 hypothetical protein [Chlorobium sp.]
MKIAIHSPEGNRSYAAVEEMPDGVLKGFASWMLYTGNWCLTLQDTIIAIEGGMEDQALPALSESDS